MRLRPCAWEVKRKDLDVGLSLAPLERREVGPELSGKLTPVPFFASEASE